MPRDPRSAWSREGTPLRDDSREQGSETNQIEDIHVANATATGNTSGFDGPSFYVQPLATTIGTALYQATPDFGVVTGYLHNDYRGYHGFTAFRQSENVYVQDRNGISHVGEHTGYTSLRHAAPAPGGQWMTAHGSGDSGWDLHVWFESEDWSGTATRESFTDVHRCRRYGLTGYVDDSNNNYWLFCEYSPKEASADRRILRADFDAATINVALDATSDLTSPVQGHLHNEVADPYNHGHHYAVAGDEASVQRWYKSTDFGQSWSEVAGTNDPTDPLYVALNLAFTESHIWWVSDYRIDGRTRLYRAPKSDPSAYEEMAALESHTQGFGVTRCYSPNGILIGCQNVESGEDTAPIYFWSFDTDSLSFVKSLPLTSTGVIGGVTEMPPVVDMSRGAAIIALDNVELHAGQNYSICEIRGGENTTLPP